MALKVFIVGGVAGGASAAARLRRVDERAEIVLFEKGEYVSFANCGLPYYIGETILEKGKLLVQTPQGLKKRFNIDVRINSEVRRIDREKKVVEVWDLKAGKAYTENYDKLVLSPGAEPIKPRLPGIESSKIFTLRNIPDTFRIKEFVDNTRPKRAIIVGAGFIGLEMAENLHKRGVKVTIVELADHVIGQLDYEMAAIVHQHLKAKDVEFYLKDALKSCEDDGSGVLAGLSSGRILKTDMIILSIGVKPDTKLAKDAGLAIGVTGGILTDRYMRTNDPDIYAVGDAVEVTDFITGSPALIPLAGPANRQGRIAANNICGGNEEYSGTLGTSIVKVFDITAAITGNNERSLKKNGIAYEKSFTHSPNHAGYYPGANPMSIKLIFAKEGGKVLGAQIVGYEGVDKRIDVIATAIRAGMTVTDLGKLELAYAPPYSSAKDPVNIAGYVASNILKNDVEIFHWDQVSELTDNTDNADNADNADNDNNGNDANGKNSGFTEIKGLLVDVRTPMEFSLGSIPGAINIPVDELRDRARNELNPEGNIYIFCQVGLRGYVAARILKQSGFKNVKNLSGGYKTWQMATQKQANEDIYEYDKINKDDELTAAGCEDGECSVVRAGVIELDT